LGGSFANASRTTGYQTNFLFEMHFDTLLDLIFSGTKPDT
jgi:hypothetical protein